MENKQSKFKKALGWYQATAIILFTAGLLFVAANVICLIILVLLPARQDPVSAKYGPEEIAKANPHLAPEEVTQLLNESWGHPINYEPYVHFREAPRQGKYVNVDEAGFRHSADQCPWPPNPEHFNLFVFGGSTTFGYGVADGETVPSHLGAKLSQAFQQKVCVYNFGRCYYQCTQERILFEQLLLQGHVPHLAIFIDGLNDSYYPTGVPARDTRIERSMMGRPSPLEAERRRLRLPATALVHELSRRNASADQAPASRGTEPPDEVAAREVSLRYVKNLGLTSRIAASYGIEAWFVWQPVPTYNYDLQHHLFAAGLEPSHWRSKSVYEHMAELRGSLSFPPQFLWCADMQQDLPANLYVDAVHYSREMSERLAAEITGKLLVQRQQIPSSEKRKVR